MSYEDKLLSNLNLQPLALSSEQWIEARYHKMKAVAYIGYGALMAINTDGKADSVLALMSRELFPSPSNDKEEVK